MPGNPEEKEKCLEKLNQMQKFVPFLDFMIDKIKKKNNEISLECQLSKFQLLRSMITEKSGKYTWDVVVKVEDVLEKLVTKLDFKEQYEKSKDNLTKPDSRSDKTSMATSISIVPSSTTGVSVTTTSSSQATAGNVKPQDFSNTTVDLIMKTFKLSVDGSANKSTDKGTESLSNSVGPNQPLDVSGKPMETDLDKDLDGFDLTDCHGSSGTESSKVDRESVKEVAEKVSSRDDLLSSSREKLLKSLQSRLFPCKTNPPSSQSSTGEKASESGTPSAFSRSHVNLNEPKTKSDVVESSEQVDKSTKKLTETPVKNPGKHIPVVSKSTVPQSYVEKIRTDSVDGNLKQKLKEKFSTDICEVYRVPGKSVGGSLRSLKESKNPKKNFVVEEVEILKPERLSERSSSRRSSDSSDRQSCHKKEGLGNNPRRDSSLGGGGKRDKHNEKTSQKHSSGKSGKSECKSKNQKRESSQGSESRKSRKDWKKHTKKGEDKFFELRKLNDEELLNFVKENIRSLPHLARLKPSELKKAVQSSAFSNATGIDADAVSEISDDSFQDLDEFDGCQSKGKSSPKRKTRPLTPTKKSPVGSDGIAKNVKQNVETSKGGKASDKVPEKIQEITLVESPKAVEIEEEEEEEDYAMKLIEETTPKVYSSKKRKKGLLELPMPITDDLFEDISSIESFELHSSPNEARDSRLTKVSDEKHKQSSSKSESNVDAREVCPGKTRDSVKDPNQRSQNQTAEKTQHGSSDPRVSKQNRGSQDGNHQFSCKIPSETNSSPCPKSSFGFPHVSDPRRPSYKSSEPKSYAEYKRLKLQEKEKLSGQSKESTKITLAEGSDSSRSAVEKEEEKTKKNLDPRHASQKESATKQINSKSCVYSPRKKSSKQLPGHSDVKERSRETKKKKEEEDRRASVDSEELVSPLEELYKSENKPKTGRGYGIQNFKIPKKVREPACQVPAKSNTIQNPTHPIVTNAESEVGATKTSKESETDQTNVSESTKPDSPVVDSTMTVEDISSKTIDKSSTDETKTDYSIRENDSTSCDVTDSSKSKIKAESENRTAPDESKKTEETPNSKDEALKVTSDEGKTVPEKVKKCEAQMVECDSSIDTSETRKESAVGDKGGGVAKEEITQEFVEALIRKSFQSGEGKLLLAQVKLFEEFARKLNSKKLKTIQKIINSESDSSSSSESSSEDEKKKKKNKKSEQKSRKRKKRSRKGRKHKSSSSSSSLESEESSEEYTGVKKEEKSNSRKKETCPENSEAASTSEENKSVIRVSSPELKAENKKPRGKNVDLSKHFSGRKAKRKQTQKKLLERILNESPQPEVTADQPVKESEPKAKMRAKAKGKTELDRLHEDIRSMFISAGVVTATGQRMCRILKQSGGNMNNLDIVKESAKMVEEERLKKGNSRTSSRNSRGSENSSRSQSVDKGTKQQQDDDERDPKIKLEPRVVLQRVDLDNFGYGVKISENCISFRRTCGQNKAIRGTSFKFIPVNVKSSRNRSRSDPGRNVFLARNKRKYERLKESKRKKVYMGKRLMDVVKNLPLKMAKMKHLQIYERKTEGETNKKKKNLPEKSRKNTKIQKKKFAQVYMSTMELLNYAFEKNRRTYFCKLCSHMTADITSHYRDDHPEHEVLISRLCKKEAKSAKLDATKNKLAEGSLGNEEKQVAKPVSRRPITYNCRMCNLSKMADVYAFADHVSAHTGEARFQCPLDVCDVQVYSREDMKFHVLTKHPQYRSEYFNKLIELYRLTIEGGKMFGFLCSSCHFVQLCRANVEDHIATQHKSSENATVLKINMSSRASRCARKKKADQNEVSSNAKSDDDESRNVDEEVEDGEVQKVKNTEGESAEVKSGKRKHRSEDESSGSVESVRNKRIFTEENADVLEVTRKSNSEDSRDPLDNEEDVEEDENLEEEEENLCNDDMEDCVDLKSISALKGSDIISSMENSEGSEFSGAKTSDTVGTHVRLKVGPLEALLSEDSGVLYECYVKGCLFSTRVFDLFEKHIKISHWKTKWNGVCDVCSSKADNESREKENSFKLLTALKHLRLHEREKSEGGKLSAEDLIMELKLLKPSEDGIGDEENSNSVEEEDEETTDEKGQKEERTDNSETPYPVKPLLRVRNLLGDRLSTPKADETDVVALNEEESNSPESSTDSSKMFTIENVRSLTESQIGDSELKIEQVCSLKDLISKPGTQLGPGKTIIVRSCPTRKIAIRSEPSAVSVDVGHINVVQPPVVGHPVVLNPMPGASPIRIISAALSPKPKYTVKPIVVSADSVRLNTPNLAPVIRPLSPAVTTTTIIPVTSPPEPKTVSQKSKPQESDSEGGENTSSGKRTLEVEVITSPVRPKSPPTPSVTIHHHPKSSSSDVEEVDEKESVATQRLATSPSTGKKSVKDAKIYQEMLTKTKLCHLFKCMGIECSFTCNNENVFTQHIGLHEAQRRLRRDKGIKTIYLRSANKTTRAFYWQQCAYCCEVVSNTNKALSQHILEEHGHCMYQCAFCFYRAVSHCYVEIHQNLAHSQILKTTPRLIYKCKPLRVPPSQFVALEKHGRKQSVRPYHCDQCGRKFYITLEFTNHLAKEHQSVTAYTCHICKNLCFKINRLINHYKLHSYSTYQCAYCLHGTETEKEMIFHLCNFHFSQPAVMYVRALAEGQSDDENLKYNKKKKHLSNQLDSLKVIVYESDTPNLDCIVDAEGEEDIPDNVSESSLDLSSIVAELGISTDPHSSTGVTPLMKELASIGDKGGKNLTVKTLLPNAQFSSENESGTENCSVLISSGLSVPSDSNSEREMNIPLGQLPLEAVNVQHKETAPSSPSTGNSVATPDRNLKLNEIIVNLHHKEKSHVLPGGAEEEKPSQPTVKLSSAVHKLPPVVLSRSSVVKNAYPSKVKKKSEESRKSSENTEGGSNDGDGKAVSSGGKSEDSSLAEGTANTENVKKASGTGEETPGSSDQPLITNVVSLSKGEFETEDSGGGDDSIIISDVCSLSNTATDAKKESVLINIQTSVPSVLKPPIIRVEDFPIDEDDSSRSGNANETDPEPKNSIESDRDKTEKPEEDRPSSPDVIILENNKSKDIVMVTIDSDEEKDEKVKKKTEKSKDSEPETPSGNEAIRQEMEKLRKQIVNETDSLLLEEPEKPVRDLSLNIEPIANEEDSQSKTLLSPIEEAICSLNKKLQSETEEAQKKEDEKKEKAEESPSKSESCENRPRTRFGARDRRREGTEGTEKSDGDECNGKKEEPGKGKKFKEELTGKDLFICGNEKCNFAADNDVTLKDHLYVCDLSRESAMFVCPHCSKQIKQFNPYLEHLKYHGEKRFHCGLCSFSSAVDSSVSRHVKQKHKCSVIKILPKESKEGHLAFYPKNYKVEKVDFEVNGYSPGDEDKLPLQSVYQVNVKCAKCPYFTKVRSNMVRHLKIHVKSVETEGVVVVPSTAPTNPVPCLETKERMFDKMTNLAASSQLAQAKDKVAVESLSPEEEAKLPQFVTEQLRYKCCLPDCNYITIDEGMLKHHIKALHDEINYYSCPHCRNTVHVDVRNVTLDKIGFHLKHHDAKLYKCAHCIFFHYQKNVVEKHTGERHPDRRFFVHTVREPKSEVTSEDEPSSSETGARVWKCGLCDDFQSISKSTLMDHLLKSHNTKSKYKCRICFMKGNSYQAFSGHFASKHPGEKVSYIKVYYSEKAPNNYLESGNSSGADSSNEHFDTTPLWQRGAPRIRHIRGILIEEEEIKTKKSKKTSVSESEMDAADTANVKENAFYCPLCTNKKKPFFTRNEECFRSHLYQELNYQQFACILCGKMFVDKKDFEKHHARIHSDKPRAWKQTNEDHEIKFWVDQVIAKRRKQMEERKRKLSEPEAEASGSQGPAQKKKKEV